MRNTIIAVVAVAIIGVGAYFYYSNKKDGASNQIIACTMEAKMCPDGSAVGRSGPNCEFAKCPEYITLPASGNVTMSLGESISLINMKLTLNSIKEDSRCPSDVTCVWVGRVVANITLSDGFDTPVERDIVLSGAKEGFNNYFVSLVGVMPGTISTKTISPSEYRVTFHIDELDAK